MPITKFNTVFDADHINSLFARQVSAITFFAQGWDYGTGRRPGSTGIAFIARAGEIAAEIVYQIAFSEHLLLRI